MKKKLIILTDNFGLKFSGGAIATCRIFKPIEDNFINITVIANQIGSHPFSDIKFLQYDTRREAIKHINSFKNEVDIVFYGDFYMTYYYILAGVPYYFTYHDNWPEQKYLSLKNRIKSFFYVPLYKLIIRKSEHTATVSEFKLKFISKLNKSTSLIRNGINSGKIKQKYTVHNPTEKLKIIMLGNIESRKFGLAPKLFEILKTKDLINQITIDIFGNILDGKLARKIQSHKNIRLKGFSESINFNSYHMLLSTSRMENLSLAVVEALANHTPVICFDVGGLKEVVKNNENGLLISKNNVVEMGVAISKIIGNKTVFNFNKQDLLEYNWEIAAAKYKKILLSI